MFKKLLLPFLTSFVWVGLITCPFSVFANENSSTTQIVVKNSSSSIDELGSVLFVVFKDGIPASNIEVKTPNGILNTNVGGTFLTKVKSDQAHQFEIVSTGQLVSVKVISGEESQVIVNLLADKQTDVQVSIPEPANNLNTQLGLNKKPIIIEVKSSLGAKIPEATILFSGINSVYKTDQEGLLKADLPEGKYSASVFHPEYQTFTIHEINLALNQNNKFDVSLRPAENSLDEVLVLAPKIKGSLSSLVEVRRQSSAVTDVLGAEQMARAGDSDAAASLRRVTGLTLVGGKYVYVRGLGERYSGVQMNSFSLPSPEPSRRVVPLDLFPTAIMESIVVQKSYSPDLPGEFGGGVIQLKTRSIPEKFFFRSTLSTQIENTNNRLEHQGGSKDWLGLDDGTRNIPDIIKQALTAGKKLEVNVTGFKDGVTQEELVAMGQSLNNNYNSSRTNTPSLPGLSFSIGDGWKFNNLKIGSSGSGLYGQNTNQLTRSLTSFSVGSGGKLERDNQRNSDFSEVETRAAASYDLGIEYDKNQKLTFSTFLLRNTTKLTQFNETTFVSSPKTEGMVMEFTERQLWTKHLKGEHHLNDMLDFPLTVDWRLGQSDARRDSPDRREITYLVTDQSKNILDNQSGNRRIYSDLKDTSNEAAINFTIPIKNSSSREFMKLKWGASQIAKERNSHMTRLYFAKDTSGPLGLDTSSDPETLFASKNIKPGVYMLKNITSDADSYSGNQKISATYFNLDVSPWESFSVQAGMRKESSIQDVNTFKYFDAGNPSATSSIKMNDLLPAYSMVWKPNDQWRARLAYSETLARPDFREMSTVGFIDDETGNIIQGNAQLKGTVIKNIDHRWEYYFNSDEYISIGAFYKNFVNPIEVLFLPGVNKIQSFANAKAANNLGIEIEGRMGLRHTSRFFRRWTVLSNVSIIKSEIELSEENRGTQTSLSRPLQGQSPYVVNFQLQYDRPIWGVSSSLLYNIIGKRITQVGTNEIPDTYEQPFQQLDLVLNEKINDNWTVSFRARNLLDPEIISTQADEIVRSQKRGRIFGLVLGAVF